MSKDMHVGMPSIDEHEPINQWFGLTYSSYMVLHRSVLQAMPVEWQRKFVTMIEQIDKRFNLDDVQSSFRVLAVDDSGKFTKDPYRDYRRGPTPPIRSHVVEGERYVAAYVMSGRDISAEFTTISEAAQRLLDVHKNGGFICRLYVRRSDEREFTMWSRVVDTVNTWSLRRLEELVSYYMYTEPES